MAVWMMENDGIDDGNDGIDDGNDSMDDGNDGMYDVIDTTDDGVYTVDDRIYGIDDGELEWNKCCSRRKTKQLEGKCFAPALSEVAKGF